MTWFMMTMMDDFTLFLCDQRTEIMRQR